MKEEESKIKIDITFDHFKPKGAARYGYRNDKQIYMRCDFTITIKDGDTTILDKSYKGKGPYPYKSGVDIGKIHNKMQNFLIEEIQPNIKSILFKKVCKELGNAMKNECDNNNVYKWESDLSDISNTPSIDDIKFDNVKIGFDYIFGEIPECLKLNDIEISFNRYEGKYLTKIVNKILKNKKASTNQDFFKIIVRKDLIEAYKFVENNIVSIENYNKERKGKITLTKREERFLKKIKNFNNNEVEKSI